jgi:hypothetical protein
MSIRSSYCQIPDYVAIPLALVVSAVMALALAVLGAVAVDSFLDGLQGTADLGHSFLAFFFAAPCIALLAFIFCFSTFVSWHHTASWLIPTFAFALGTILVWFWASDFGGIGFVWYLPGTTAWLICCWFLPRRSIFHSNHVLQT